MWTRSRRSCEGHVAHPAGVQGCGWSTVRHFAPILGFLTCKGCCLPTTQVTWKRRRAFRRTDTSVPCWPQRGLVHPGQNRKLFSGSSLQLGEK